MLLWLPSEIDWFQMTIIIFFYFEIFTRFTGLETTVLKKVHFQVLINQCSVKDKIISSPMFAFVLPSLRALKVCRSVCLPLKYGFSPESNFRATLPMVMGTIMSRSSEKPEVLMLN